MNEFKTDMLHKWRSILYWYVRSNVSWIV